MKSLQILPELELGGVETGTVDLAKYLVNHHQETVVVSAGGELVEALQACGAVHYNLAVHKKSLFSMLRCVFRLAEIIRKEGVDVVHARSRVPAWIAYLACRLTHTVFLTTCHGYYSKHLMSRVMGWGKFVVAPSQIIARHMIDDFAVCAQRIRIIPRSVDREKFTFIPPEHKSRTEFVVAIIGRLTPLKGHIHFIKAMQKVRRVIPNIKVWIIGAAAKSRPHYREDLELLVKRLGLSDIVEFLGKRRDIPELLSKINLLVLASTAHEAFGRVVLEAQAAGVPVVATRVGGVVDIIDDGVDGVLVTPGDPDSMSGGVIKVLKDQELSSMLAKNAYVKVCSKFSLKMMAEKTLELYHEAVAAKNILVIKLSALGDLILSIPALKSIRKAHPSPCKITCLAGKALAPVLNHCPYIDNIIIYDFKDRDKGIFGLLRLGRQLRDNNFDFVIDLQNNRKSHILSALSFAYLRYGYKNGKLSFLLNKRAAEDKFVLPPIEHQFRILKMLGIELKDRKIELWPSKEDMKYIDTFLESEWLNKGQPLAGIHLGSSGRWLTKRWPLEYIARLSENLAGGDIRVVITGEQPDPEELKMLRELAKKSRPIIACGKTTINQLVCLIRRCSVFVAGDTAPLHIASAVGTPVVALFGPTDPKRHAPSEEDVTILRKELPCQPCYKPECATMKCMKQLKPEEVEQAILKLLSHQKVVNS